MKKTVHIMGSPKSTPELYMTYKRLKDIRDGKTRYIYQSFDEGPNSITETIFVRTVQG